MIHFIYKYGGPVQELKADRFEIKDGMVVFYELHSVDDETELKSIKGCFN